MNYKYLFLLLICLICACQSIRSQKVIKDGIEILYGPVTQEQLFYDYPSWKNIYDQYKPDKKIIGKIKKYKDENVSIDIFLGTWCDDSRREVPGFLKIISASRLVSQKNIRLFAVDRHKNLDNNVVTNNKISRVATFIIKMDGIEKGRITEYPDQTLEKDLLLILENIRYD